MPSPAGPSLGSSATNETFAESSGSWNNPSNALIDDTTYTNVNTNGTWDTTPTAYLKITGFGFSIPAGATIDGIVVTHRSTGFGSNVRDARLRLVKAGTTQSGDRASSTPWGSDYSDLTRGGSSDLWDGTWAYSDINDSGFGVSLSAGNVSAGGETVRCQWVKVTVYYTEGGGGGQPVRTMHQTRMRRAG